MAYDKTLTVLADPTRRAVFERLKGGPRSVAEIAAGLPVSRPAVSQHLKALKEADLVRDEPRGTARIYRIHAPGLVELRAWLDGFWDEALANFKAHAEKDDDGR
ncbi:MAG TPA: metalloregulator ArsR/SmtB family transcription factor [Caulobacterales bacterium]|nr:metalloregulator ArsR/SmtB family transcription factor [Caulobacterales bacterium]